MRPPAVTHRNGVQYIRIIKKPNYVVDTVVQHIVGKLSWGHKLNFIITRKHIY